MYSQFGEDGYLIRFFNGKQGNAVDVGAGDGKSGSNTLALESIGWKVLCIEPNPLYPKKLAAPRKFTPQVAWGSRNADEADFHVFHTPGFEEAGEYQALSALKPDERIRSTYATGAVAHSVHKVPVRTLDSCLEDFGFDGLDLICIDVEGAELDVLDGFSMDRWHPQLAIVENGFDDPKVKMRFLSNGYGIADKIRGE